MQNFVTSPGITPLVTDLTILGFVLSLMLAIMVRSTDQAHAIYYVLGMDTVAISLIKIITDYYDLGDLILSCGALAAGLSVVLLKLNKSRRQLSLPLTILGIFAAALGTIKVLRDFYDPFDLVLACCTILVGALILKQMLNKQSHIVSTETRG
jgi:hypothetical protein